MFVLYIKDISAIIRRHGLWNHCYADDYFYCKPEEVNSLTLSFLARIDDLCGWMQSNRLKLNADTTECVWVITRQRQSTFAAPKLTVGGSIIVPTKGTCNHGIFFDSKLDLKLHISNICRTCYFQLRQLRTVRRSLQREILKTLFTCLCLLPVGLLQLSVCRSAHLRHSSTTVGTECCCMPIWQCVKV